MRRTTLARTAALVVVFAAAGEQPRAQAPAAEWVFLDGPWEASALGVVRWTNGRHMIAGPGGNVFEEEGGRWLHRPSPAGPLHRQLATYAYDVVDDIVYVFGGRRDGVYLDELWAWDGTKWSDLSALPGPSPRWDAELAYDILRDRLVLFGGWGTGTHLDTWEFDGSSWQQMSPTTAPSERGTAMTYDLQAQQCVLVTHGGVLGVPGKTWTWDGSDWTLADQNGPATGQGSAMAYDLGRDVSVFVGGNPVSDQIWEWDGAGWTQVATLPMTGGRYRPSLSYDPLQGAVQMFGGQPLFSTLSSTGVGPYATDAWLWDGQSLTQLHGDLRPPSRHSAMFVEDPSSGELVVFGGAWGMTLFGDTWAFDGDRWREVQPATPPPARIGAAGAADPITARLLMYGGFSQGVFRGDLWSFDGSDWTELVPVGASPAPRQAAAFAHDPNTATMLMYGGSTGPLYQAGTSSAQTWRWNGLAWTQLQIPGPPAREGAAMAYDPASGDMLLWGGRDGTTAADQKNDFWRFDGSSWQQVVTAHQPPALFYPALYHDPQLGRMVLSGAAIGLGNELWAFDGVDWVALYAASDATVSGRTVRSSTRGHPFVYTGSSLVELSTTKAQATSLGGACGAQPPRLELRTRPRLGSPEFGFDVHTDVNDLVVIAVSDGPGAVPLGGCTLQLGGAIWPTLHLADAFGIARQPLPLPVVPALRGQAFYAQGVAWDASQPLSALRLTDARRFVLGD